ncbi:DNA-binding response OmpR family regulator OS=Streptomyces violarus OX=67380 GN=FHS41_002271 PE=4 SV=1 [Streptomyces violarus]
MQAARPVPVMMLTARDDETDMLVGLGVGADDYMTKPFSMRELAAQCTCCCAVLSGPRWPPRRRGRHPAPRRTGDRPRRSAGTGARSRCHLTPTEFDLLVCLANTPRAVLSREQLLAEVWDWADASGTRTVDSHIKALRRKIGAERIRTVHGVGYALETPTP